MTACGAGRRKDQCGLHDSGGTSSSTEENRRRRRCQADEHARQLEAGLTESPAAGIYLVAAYAVTSIVTATTVNSGFVHSISLTSLKVHRLAIDV